MILALSLNAYAQQSPTDRFKADLVAACNAPRLANARTITLQGDVEVLGNELFYPPAACTNVNPSDLIILGGGNTIKGLAQPANTDASFNLLQVTAGQDQGTSVTLRNIVFEGVLVGDDGSTRPAGFFDSIEETISPVCARTGGNYRGLYIQERENNPSTDRARLVVENAIFRCLDAGGDGGVGNGQGGAILADDVLVEVRNSTFEFNTAANSGGAIALEGTTFGLSSPVDVLQVDKSVFYLNDALNAGGAIYNSWERMNSVIYTSRFDTNVGAAGAGGVELVNQRNVDIQRNGFDRQNPLNLLIEQRGGSVNVDSADLYLTPPANEEQRGQLTFRNNIVCGSWAGRGGGLSVNTFPEIAIENNIFAENGALVYGGGLYVESAYPVDPNISVLHNTFVGNEAGRTPPRILPPVIYTYGGGGGAAFFGLNPEFRNNVVSETRFGGGVLGEYIPFTSDGFQIGDRLDFHANVWFENEDDANDVADVTGDFASISFHPSNFFEIDPGLAYLGLGEFNCVPEAFYQRPGSVLVNNGAGPLVPATGVLEECADHYDTTVPVDFINDVEVPGDPACDIGAFGGLHSLWTKDSDGDGVTNIYDCDDYDATVNPSIPEECDFKDNDCNGLVDDGLQSVWYIDADNDGAGAASTSPRLSCIDLTPDGYVSSTDGNLNNDDCDDSRPDVAPGLPEICDGIDNNCDGVIDEGLPVVEYFFDLDMDGYGRASAGTACIIPFEGAITTGGDCNDDDPARNPGAVEVCGNGIDDDCDDAIDANDTDITANVVSLYPDIDGDGFGAIDGTVRRECRGVTVAGLVADNTDCNDNEPLINPGRQEFCATVGIDDNCNGLVDEQESPRIADGVNHYQDQDGDGIGLSNQSGGGFLQVCDPIDIPVGRVTSAGDCNDQDPAVGVCSTGCTNVAFSRISWIGVMFGLVAAAGRRRRSQA